MCVAGPVCTLAGFVRFPEKRAAQTRFRDMSSGQEIAAAEIRRARQPTAAYAPSKEKRLENYRYFSVFL